MTKTCGVTGCSEKATRKSLCGMHYARLRRTGKTGNAERLTKRQYPENSCKIQGCGRKAYGGDLCEMHYARFQRNGEPGAPHPLRVKGRLCSVSGMWKAAQRQRLLRHAQQPCHRTRRARSTRPNSRRHGIHHQQRRLQAYLPSRPFKCYGQRSNLGACICHVQNA